MQVRGSILRSRVHYVRAHQAAALPLITERLPPELQEALPKGFLETRWYPFPWLTAFTDAADAVMGRGDQRLAYEMGRFSCDQNLPTLYRVFFRFGSPRYILDRAAKAWRAQFDAGDMAVIETTPTSATVELSHVPEPHRGHCLGVTGWISRAVELTGEDLQGIDETCRAAGDERCTWHVRWL
jgi:hypothetical protein